MTSKITYLLLTFVVLVLECIILTECQQKFGGGKRSFFGYSSYNRPSYQGSGFFNKPYGYNRPSGYGQNNNNPWGYGGGSNWGSGSNGGGFGSNWGGSGSNWGGSGSNWGGSGPNWGGSGSNWGGSGSNNWGYPSGWNWPNNFGYSNFNKPSWGGFSGVFDFIKKGEQFLNNVPKKDS